MTEIVEVLTSLRPDLDSFQRKEGHIVLAEESQTKNNLKDPRFFYEPLLYQSGKIDLSRKVLNKKVQYPIWISSMTGGTERAKLFNENLARVAKSFGLGMGLGSLRPLLFDDSRFSDFHVRPFIGEDLPLLGNIGINQVEELFELKKLAMLDELSKRLELDGLFIHINLLQEWFQPRGDVLKNNPLKILTEALSVVKTPIFIKEVGHGFGPLSLKKLMELPIAGLEFGAFGGTNFSLLEEKRKVLQVVEHPLIYVGHSADEMMDSLIELSGEDKEMEKIIKDKLIIASGGFNNFLDGYYAISKLSGINSAMYAHAKEFIVRAHSLNDLQSFVEKEIHGLEMAHRVLVLNNSRSKK